MKSNLLLSIDRKATLFHDRYQKEMNRVKRAVQEFREKKINKVSLAHDHREVLSISTKVYMKVTLSQIDDTHYEGYSMEVDPKTYEIIGGKYFHSAGANTYREAELSPEELSSVIKYYDLEDAAPHFCENALKN